MTNLQRTEILSSVLTCGEYEETQEHVIECKDLLKLNMEVTNIPKYDKLFEGTLKEQL